MEAKLYSQVDGELAEALLRAVAREASRAPTLLGVRPRGVTTVDVQGSARLRKAVTRAGFLEPAALAKASLLQLGEAADSLTVDDLDALHAERVRASYADSPFDANLVNKLVEHHIHKGAAAGVGTVCGGQVHLPDKWADVNDAYLDLFNDPDRFLYEVPFAWEEYLPTPVKPPLGWPPEPDDHLDGRDGIIVDLGGFTRVVHVDGRVLPRDLDGLRTMADEMLGAAVTADEVAPALGLAHRLLDIGQPGLAREVAEHVARADRRKLGATGRYQVDVLSAGITTRAAEQLGDVGSQTRSAVQAISHAVEGSDPHVEAVRSTVRMAVDGGNRALAHAGALPGPAGRSARLRARVGYLHGLTGAHLGEVASKAAIAPQSTAVLVDANRALVDAFNGEDMETIAWRMGPGGLGSMADPIVKANVLQAMRQVRELQDPIGANAPVTLPGDLFRFDFLLDEARRLTDDIARIEQLTATFMQMLVDLDIAKIAGETEIATGVINEVVRLIGELTKRVNAIKEQLPGIIAGLASTVRDAALVAGIIGALAKWPHERWVDIIVAFITAVIEGANPIDAVLEKIDGWVRQPLVDEVDKIKKRIETMLGEVQKDIDKAVVPAGLAAELQKVLDTVGSSKNAEHYLKPLRDALASLKLTTLAQGALNSVSALSNPTGPLPGWVRALLIAYVAAPLVAAFAVYLASGPAGWILLAALITLGSQYIVSLVLRALSGALDRLNGVEAAIEAARGRLMDLVAALANSIGDLGTVQALLAAALDALQLLQGKLGAVFPDEIRAALQDALVGAKTVIVSHARGLVGALQRAFFRETLELVEVPAGAFAGQLPLGGTIAGFSDPTMGTNARVASILAGFEAERVARTDGVLQQVTQVLSLRQLLGSAAALQPLLQGDPVNVEVTHEVIDRIAPGFHRALIKDVTVHLDFDVPAGTEAALATVLASAAAVAGGQIDPALVGAVPGGGFPGLPVTAGRAPTGIPAVLTHSGRSTVRLKPSATLAAAYGHPCDPGRPSNRTGPLRNTRLLADPDADAHERGWRKLEFLDPPASMLLSHFDVLADGVRFLQPDKQVKPFEHRGLLGEWTLEIPALALGSVVHQLPPIRDVRLVVSTVGRYDRELAALVPQQPVPVTEPSLSPLPGGLPLQLDLTGLADELKQAVEALLQQLLGDVATTLTEGMDQLLAQLDTVVGQVTAGLSQLTDGVSLDMAALSATARGLTAALAQELTRLTGLSGGSSTQLRGVLLSTAGLDTGQVTALLAGGSVSWMVTNSMLQQQGVDPSAVQRVAGAVVSPLLSTGLSAITTPSFPAAYSSLAHGNTVVPFRLGLEPGLLDGDDFTSNPPLTDADGTWTLTLPSGMPSALTGVLVLLLLEVPATP